MATAGKESWIVVSFNRGDKDDVYEVFTSDSGSCTEDTNDAGRFDSDDCADSKSYSVEVTVTSERDYGNMRIILLVIMLIGVVGGAGAYYFMVLQPA